MVLPGHSAAADCALLGAGHPVGIGGVRVWQAVHSWRCYRRWSRQMGLAGRCPGQPAGNRFAAVHVRHPPPGRLFFRAGRSGRSSGGVHDGFHPAQSAAFCSIRRRWVHPRCSSALFRAFCAVVRQGGWYGPAFGKSPSSIFEAFMPTPAGTRIPICLCATCSTCCATSGLRRRGSL